MGTIATNFDFSVFHIFRCRYEVKSIPSLLNYGCRIGSRLIYQPVKGILLIVEIAYLYAKDDIKQIPLVPFIILYQ